METQSTDPNNAQTNQSGEINDVERWGSLITGGALVLTGLRQRSLRGALLAIAGGGLAYHGAKGQKSLQTAITEATGTEATGAEATGTPASHANKSIRVEKTVTIFNKSPEELYRFWHNFENLPRFMPHLKSVTVIDDRRSHWIANAALDQTIEWDAELINDQENQLIGWASLEGADVDHSGFVRFKPSTQGHGTEVKVVMEYAPPGGEATNTIAKLLGESPEQKIGEDLSRFKMLMEAGEVATTAGQSSGRQ